MPNKIFFRPETGVIADIIPFFEKGVFHLFYLRDFRDRPNHGEGTPWYHLTSTDLSTFTDLGEALPRGRVDEQDLYVFTGSVCKGLGRYHIFYTGHNPHLRQEGKNEQAIMHAVSDDLNHWTKVPEDTFFAPEDRYEPHDWRDPFVFFNESDQRFWMIAAARTREGAAIRKGCTVLCTSADLKHWDVKQPFWAPSAFFTHECPDLFKIGKWYYLVFSEFSDKCYTRYRMSQSLNGPWISPRDDAFDGRAYYAAKSVSDGQNRYLFGWVPTKVENNDTKSWQWGGNLVAHKMYQKRDGSLGVDMPSSVRHHFSKKELWKSSTMVIDGTQGCLLTSIPLELPESYRIVCDVTLGAQATRGGIALRYSAASDESYLYGIDLTRQQLNFGCFPNHPWEYSNFVGVNHPLDVKEGKTYHLEIIVEQDVCVAYLDGTIALSCRMHTHAGSPFALVAMDGSVLFDHLVVTAPESNE